MIKILISSIFLVSSIFANQTKNLEKKENCNCFEKQKEEFIISLKRDNNDEEVINCVEQAKNNDDIIECNAIKLVSEKQENNLINDSNERHLLTDEPRPSLLENK